MTSKTRYFRSEAPGSDQPKRAITYLRVSTSGQVKTDYDPEGISLPAQRRKCAEQARELGVETVDEYLEPGRSATAIHKRPEFKKMIARIREQRDVDYVIFYSLSRMHRNWAENGITYAMLRELGVTMISATEKFDDTPLGEAMHGFLAVFNGFQSRANGEDIRFKMGEKARRGGTISQAPLGYLNVGEQFEGREIRSVAIDPERAPLIRIAFELYATGKYTFRSLRQALTEAGLRTRPTAARPAKAISIHKIGNLLRDRYYLGYVTYQGVEFQGRHPALIDPELFERVQKVLAAERRSGTRERAYNHYLKGVVWCGRCERRLIIARAQGRHGGQYFYYFCRGRQERTCDLPYIVVERIEEAVLRHYGQVRIPAEVGDRLRTAMDQTVANGANNTRQLRAQYAKRLKALDAREDRYLDLVGDPDWPREKVSGRMRAIRDERASLKRQLDDADGELQVGYQVVAGMLELLADPQELYRVAQKRTRAILNKAIFTKLFIDFEGEGPYVAADELTEPFETVVYLRREGRTEPATGTEAASRVEEPRAANGEAEPTDDGRKTTDRLRRRFALAAAHYERRDDSGVPLAEDATTGDVVTVPGLLDYSLWGVGSSKTGMVGRVGLEPTTDGL
ncbi:recombinase family protein [Candidatus Protofrankia californiensis]|uniref:recombinase family protein n=1 Tax=Candidatus Protofrankia californiensis TaxID=1839754 RepID=UPI003D328A99